MPKVHVNGKSLYYYATESGNKTEPKSTILLIHGLGSSSAFYSSVVSHLDPSIHYVAFDFPGSGLSELGDSEQSISSIATDAIGLLDVLNITEKVTVIGHSMGGIVASHLAAAYSDRVNGVVLIGPVHPSDAISKVFEDRIQILERDGIEAFASTVPAAATGEASTPLQRAFIRNLILRTSTKGYSSLCHVIATAPKPDYATIKVPLLIVAGADDKTAPIAGCEAILNSYSTVVEDKKIEVLDGVGHWHCIEAGEVVAEKIQMFVLGDSMLKSGPNKKKDFHVAIVGGGLGGLCLAIGLVRQNISCRVYEAASKFSEIGAGVSYGPNSIRAMGLIDPRIIEGFKECWTVNGLEEKKETWFDFRTAQDVGTRGGNLVHGSEHVAEVKSGGTANVGQNSVHRAHFLDVLVKLIPEDVPAFGKRLVDIVKTNDKLVLNFGDGTSAEADAVVGCDGIKSRTREMVLGKDHEANLPVFSGKYAYRGLIPMEKAAAALGAELARNSQMYMGLHGHVLTFPIEKGKTMNVVAFKTKPDGIWTNKEWILTSNRNDMIRDFSGFDENVNKIIALMEKSDLWGLFHHPPAPSYYKRRLCLLGDAAHASTPHQGAGAGQAIEDAYVLSHILGQVSCKSHLEHAFRAYDAVRRPRSQRVVTTSAAAGRLYEMEDEEAGTDLDKIRENLLTRYQWIWDIDLEAHLQEAKDLFRDATATG